MSEHDREQSHDQFVEAYEESANESIGHSVSEPETTDNEDCGQNRSSKVRHYCSLTVKIDDGNYF